MLTKVLAIEPSINGSYVYYGILTIKPTLEFMFDDDDERRGTGRRGGGEGEDQDGLRSVSGKKDPGLKSCARFLGR